MPRTTSFVGRQPIFDRDRKVAAYELLFRSSEENRAIIAQPELACATTLLGALVDIGLDALIGGARGFVNVSEGMLFGPQLDGLPKDRITLEILEDVRPTPEVLARVKALSERGFQIALDDYIGSPEHAPLIELADIVKVDVLSLGARGAAETARRMPGKRLLAEKVETQADYDVLRDAGYDLFQGYFFCRPTVVKAGKLSSGRLTALRLVRLLQDPSADLRALEELIRSDVALSYRLFRYANSAFTQRARPISSVRDAISSLGIDAVRSLVSLLALSGDNGATVELLIHSVIRARMCELVAEGTDVQPGEAFTAGLFSMLDTLMGVEMRALVEQLGVTGELAQALVHGAGASGKILRDVETYQNAVVKGTPTDRALSPVYLQAMRWAQTMVPALEG